MDDYRYIPTWQRLALILLLLSLGFTALFILTRSGFAHADLVPSASPDNGIDVQPVLTPTYTTLCDSNWYTITVAALGGQTAYLTRNVSSTVESTNRGEWRPMIPEDGTYRVEAFIPSHIQIHWACPDTVISGDTRNALYTIHYDDGQITTTLVDQLPLNDEWVTLGNYPFKAGSDGYVSLSDVTSETISTTTVSFSSIRWLRNTYLPFVAKNAGQVNLTQTWTTDNAGSPRTVFLPNEPIRFYASGTNSNEAAVIAGLKMSLTGSCYSGTIYDGVQSLDNGIWSIYKTANAPSCLGVFTLTVNVTYQDGENTLSFPFIVSASTIALKNIPAFDKCTVPTTAQMQTWWDHSPYQAINIYMGGISYPSDDCKNVNLTAFWVQAVSQQGWTFIPTWVGPQAPCFGYKYPMSSNASVSYTQGRSEADKAFNASAGLGFDEQSVLYYDLEAYANANATSACRNAVKSFINGWVERLHERGARAGVYGGDCTSYINDWYTISHIPDDVWVANWYANPHYDPYASVYDLTCLVDDNKWAGHRIRQYAGSFNNTWGGLSMTIDADVVDGEVTAIPLTQFAVVPLNEASGSTSLAGPVSPGSQSGHSNISSFQPVSEGQGWAQLEGRLLWYSGAGIWKEITPAQAVESQLLSAFFLDTHQGWSVIKDVATGQLILYYTQDTGASWRPTTIPIPEGADIASVTLTFLNSQNGWLNLKLASGSSFSRGFLYKTTDSGKTWTAQPLPVAGSVHFVDANRGWVVGGPDGDKQYATKDGGVSWQLQQLDLGQGFIGPSYPSLPSFTSDQEGWLAVTVSDPLQPYVAIFITFDAGENWSKRGIISLEPGLNPTSAIPSVLLDRNQWLLASPGKPSIYTLQTASKPDQSLIPTSPVTGLPETVVQINQSSTTMSWALTQEGDCSGTKPKPGEVSPPETQPIICFSSTNLWQTTDGGATWVDITPPSSFAISK